MSSPHESASRNPKRTAGQTPGVSSSTLRSAPMDVPDDTWPDALVEAAAWPDFVNSWPEAKLEFEGLTGRILNGECGYVMFMAADRDVYVPEHHHGAQWGVVLAGEMQLSIGGQTQTFYAGDAHYIPAGVDHAAVLRAGWKGVYMFDRRGKV